MLRHLPLLIAFFATPAFACISFPKTIELKDASFSSVTNLSYSSSCGAGVFMTLKSEDTARSERYAALSKERRAWREKNPEPAFDSPAYEGYSNEQKKFEDSLAAKYPEKTRALNIALTHRGGKWCLQRGKDECTSVSNFAITDERGKTVGIFDINERRAIFYSVNEKGEKDASKPALMLRPTLRSSMDLLSYDKRNLVGDLDVYAESCSKSIGSAGTGAVELRGKSLTTAGSGCSNGLTEKEFGKDPAKKSTDLEADGFQ